MTREEAKREILFAKREVMADSWIDKAYDVAIEALSEPESGIIRCKDCKYWREGDVYSYCNKMFSMGVLDVYDYMREEDDFCSLAERREDA